MRKKFLIILGLPLLVIASTMFIAGMLITADIEKETVKLGPAENWFDDWYTISRIDDKTFAIGEPRYWQRNYNYLILGEKRAILFDTGPGVRDIRPVLESLTSMGITVVFSHPHYDHIGNNHLFHEIAGLDIPSIRSEVTEDIFEPSYLRGFTTRRIPAFPISEWWQPGQQVDLGGRSLLVFHVPGHEIGSIALLDPVSQQLFTGDFIYPGWLVAFAPTSDLESYLKSARYLLNQTKGGEILLGAHSVPEHPSPVLPYRALLDLEKTLQAIISHSIDPVARFPLRIYPVSKEMELYMLPF